MKNILVIGSLAYDFIMNFDDCFADHILPDKIHILNVSFTAKKLSREFGGTAGNIAYNLSLLKEQPIIVACAGKDFDDYRKWLISHKIDVSYIKILKDQYTASAHIITDKDDNQITAFYGGAMLCNTASIKDVLTEKKIDIAILAPDCKEGMIRHARELKELKIPYIFDPGQQLPALSPRELKFLAQGSKASIFNDYELQLFQDKTKLSLDKVKKMTEYLIITLAKHGSKIFYQGKEYKIPPAKPKNEQDPTGAGDAYRAGILKGFVSNTPIETMGRIASLVAVYTVEQYGTQTHKFTFDEFKKRYKENFKEELKI